MRVAVVDIDDTLFLGGRISFFLWHISLFIQRIGRKLQRVNSTLLLQLEGYERVIVLTGRDEKEVQFTKGQLRRAGVKFDSLICCPRKKLINEWKAQIVGDISHREKVVWFDDIFEEAPSKVFGSQAFPNVTPLRPINVLRITKKREKDSELEWL